MEKNLKRLAFTISKQNRPNENDLIALNNIIDYVNLENERLINNHQLFAKMYISYFNGEIKRNRGNYQLSADNARMILRKSLNDIYEEFYRDMNELEFEKFSKHIGLIQKLPYERTEKEDAYNMKLIKENATKLSELMNHYNRGKVYDRLNKLIVKLIEDEKNYKK